MLMVGDSVRARSSAVTSFGTFTVARAPILDIHVAMSAAQYLVVDSGEGDNTPLIGVDRLFLIIHGLYCRSSLRYHSNWNQFNAWAVLACYVANVAGSSAVFRPRQTSIDDSKACGPRRIRRSSILYVLCLALIHN